MSLWGRQSQPLEVEMGFSCPLLPCTASSLVLKTVPLPLWHWKQEANSLWFPWTQASDLQRQTYTPFVQGPRGRNLTQIFPHMDYRQMWFGSLYVHALFTSIWWAKPTEVPHRGWLCWPWGKKPENSAPLAVLPVRWLIRLLIKFFTHTHLGLTSVVHLGSLILQRCSFQFIYLFFQ